MQTAWRPTPSRLAGALAAAVAAAPTCREPGLSGADPAPPGLFVLEGEAVVGEGEAVWERVSAALLRWELQREAGLVVAVDRDTVVPGATVLNTLVVGPVGVGAPCRVTALLDGPGRRGYAYATLPGHPLVGEERFTVELSPADGRVRWRLRSVSRPAGLAALCPPAARAVQRLVNGRYAAAAVRLAS